MELMFSYLSYSSFFHMEGLPGQLLFFLTCFLEERTSISNDGNGENSAIEDNSYWWHVYYIVGGKTRGMGTRLWSEGF